MPVSGLAAMLAVKDGWRTVLFSASLPLLLEFARWMAYMGVWQAMLEKAFHCTQHAW